MSLEDVAMVGFNEQSIVEFKADSSGVSKRLDIEASRFLERIFGGDLTSSCGAFSPPQSKQVYLAASLMSPHLL